MSKIISLRLFRVVLACIFVLIAPIQNIFSKNQQQCIDAATLRHNARVEQLDKAYETAMAPVIRKYSRMLQVCEYNLIVEIAGITAATTFLMSGCNLDPEPVTRLACFDQVMRSAEIATAVVLVQYGLCNHSAWIDFDASFDPLYTRLQEDYAASWTLLQMDYDACIRNGNQG